MNCCFTAVDSDSAELTHTTTRAQWDGLKSIKTAPVVVLGATNRPESIDKAILRRMPLMVRTPMPDANGRRDIIRKMLTLERLEQDVSHEEVPD